MAVVTQQFSKSDKDKIFDEERFVNECLYGFAEIRKKYNLDEDLEWTQQNSQLKHLAAEVIKGCTQQGILTMASRESGWKSRNVPYRWCRNWFSVVTEVAVLSKTDDWIKNMKLVYGKKCKELRGYIELFKQFPEILREKEKRAAEGDVGAMVFLGKLYAKGTLYSAKDEEKARFYMKQAREAYADILNKRYTLWLDRTVQRSGMEIIGRIGREYIAGTFEEEGKKNRDLKLKKEMRWLRSASKTGDGWAAFTLGHICYYGYGHWKGHMREAYDNYSLAASSKDSIYALEMGDLCYDKPGGVERELENACRFNRWLDGDLSWKEWGLFEESSKMEDSSLKWAEENMRRDFLSEAKEVYDEGDYENAWILAQRAMIAGWGADTSLKGEGMLVDMVKNGKWNVNIESMKEEPEINVEGEIAKTTVCVKNSTGICETTAAILAGVANRFNSNIEIHKGIHKVNAKHVMMLEALGMMKGTKLDIRAEGKDAEEAVRSIGKLILNRFSEE